MPMSLFVSFSNLLHLLLSIILFSLTLYSSYSPQLTTHHLLNSSPWNSAAKKIPKAPAKKLIDHLNRMMRWALADPTSVSFAGEASPLHRLWEGT